MIVLLANAIDFVAAMIQVGSGSIKKKEKILLVQILQMSLQGISMLLLGGITGTINNVLSCFRNYLCYKGKLSLFWKNALTAVSLLMTILVNEQGIIGVIPFAICTVYIYLMDMKDPIGFKLLVTLCFLPWTVYHFVLRSYVGAFFDVAALVSNGITCMAMMKNRNK